MKDNFVVFIIFALASIVLYAGVDKLKQNELDRADAVRAKNLAERLGNPPTDDPGVKSIADAVRGLRSRPLYVLDEETQTLHPEETIRDFSIMTTNKQARLAIIIQDEEFDHSENLVAEKIKNGKSFILVKTQGVIYKAELKEVLQDPETEEYKRNSKVIECYTAYWGKDESN